VSKHNYDLDDRGNVVDIYDNDEIVARLDREAGPKADQLVWECNSKQEPWIKAWMITKGYGKELDEAVKLD
jgi:hypothetical protein